MRWWQRLATELRNVFLWPAPGAVWPYGVPTSANEPITTERAVSLTAVWACVSLIAGTITSMPLILYKRLPDGDRERYVDHPLFELLRSRPNPGQPASAFWENMVTALLLPRERVRHAHARRQRAGTRAVVRVPGCRLGAADASGQAPLYGDPSQRRRHRRPRRRDAPHRRSPVCRRLPRPQRRRHLPRDAWLGLGLGEIRRGIFRERRHAARGIYDSGALERARAREFAQQFQDAPRGVRRAASDNDPRRGAAVAIP